MRKTRTILGWVASCLLLSSAAASAQDTSTIKKILQYQPKQANIDFSVPTEAEIPACEVKLVSGTKQGSSGWLLLDAKKRPLRRFFDSNGDKHIDMFSYFKDGLEVYRETDTNFDTRVDEYRWFNNGGMKWGVDSKGTGKIDSWKMISAEEAAQEAYQAVIHNDLARFQALLITDAEMQALQLPAAYIEKINAKLKQIPAKFAATASKITAPADKNAPGRVESAAPHCVPGDSIGTTADLFRYPSRAVLYQVNEKQHEWVQTGEMVQVNLAWRLIDAPFLGDANNQGGGNPGQGVDSATQKVMDEIAKLDAKNLKTIEQTPGVNPQAASYYLERVDLIDQLLPKLAADQKEIWIKQKGDNLSAAAMHSPATDTKAITRLRQFRDEVVQQMPKTNLAGYLTFRALWTEFAPKLTGNDPKVNLPKVQAEWMEKLASFVQEYSKAEDTPSALEQLAMGSEFGGKEDEAKRWYGEMAKNFPQHPLAAKAEGAIRRLSLVGNKMALAANTLSGQQFDITGLKGKVVVVYYWASYCTTCAADFAKLKRLHDDYRAKGFEIVTVNLDDQAADAAKYLQQNPLTGFHLFTQATEGGGMNSPLATQYGIMGLPTVFLIGKDGNVISRSIQINDLEDAIKKAQ